jgi:hypothetical protein
MLDRVGTFTCFSQLAGQATGRNELFNKGANGDVESRLSDIASASLPLQRFLEHS